MANVPKSRRLKALATYKVLIAQARAELGTAKVDNRTIAGVAKIAALSAVGKPRLISAAVRATFLTFGAETGRFFIPLSLEDTLTAGEIRNFNISKLKINEINAVDRALAEVYKALSDQVLASDVTAAFVGKTFSDVANASEILVQGSAKALFDNPFALDALEKSLGTKRQDQFQASEELLLDAAKQLDDLLNIGDVDVFDMSKPLGDLFSAADTPAKGVSKGFQDQTSTSEFSSRHFYKAVFDAVSATDSLYFFLGAYRTSGVSTTEDVEVVRISASGVPPQQENQFFTDLAALGINKNLNDNVGVTDDVYGEANIDDDQVTFVGKNVPQTVSASDLRATALQRTLQESLSATATGLVSVTNYCDSTYFSQAYVGIEQTF